MKHTRFEENILVDESYGGGDRGEHKKSGGIAQHFADSLERYDERSKWFHQLPEEPPVSRTLTEQEIEELRKEGSSALHADTLAYEHKASKSGSSEQQWARTLMKKGAIGDRVAAATVLIQESPVHNMSALRSLVVSVKPAKKRDGIISIEALSELFVSDLLVPGVKLRKLEQHALAHMDDITSGNKHTRRNILKLWYFEDQLRQLYREYVEALSVFAQDSVDSNREKAVSSMSYLLMFHPEQEKVLLSNIVNKFGDPSQSVTSKVIYHLCQLLYNHPNMKSVVLAEIERMLFRTNISPRAQYYGVCFLNQFHLDKDDAAVAENLIRVYFSFFKANIKKGEINSRLMSAILTGVKRAYPFADKSRLEERSLNVAAVHQIVHLGKFNMAIHALALLFHISDASDGLSDRYYCALYSKLNSAELFGSSHCALLFSLIYKSLKRDKNVARVTAFVRRCVRLATHMSPAHACGILFLLSQVSKDKDKKNVIKLMHEEQQLKQESTDEPSQNGDVEVKEEEEEEKVEKEKVSTRVELLKGNKRDLLDDDSEEEYVDVKEEGEGEGQKLPRGPRGWLHRTLPAPSTPSTPSAVQSSAPPTRAQLTKAINMDKVITCYKPYARNPAYAGAELAACAELLPLASHFHPTVRLFAQRLLHGELIQYSGDPLKDFSGVRFLDRFAFKNPKRRADVETQTDESGVKKVKGSHPKFALRKNYTAKGLKSLAVTSASYLNEDSKKIPVDELFLYDYLRGRRERDNQADETEKDSDAESDADSVTSEDFNLYLDRVTGAEREESDEEGVGEGEGLDFMSAVSERRVSGRNNARRTEDDETGAELDVSNDENSDQDDELLLEGSSEDDEDEERQHRPSAKRGGATRGDTSSLFASAEEFSTLLEEAGAEPGQGTSGATATEGGRRGGGGTKQVAWEEHRNKWLSGYRNKLNNNKTVKRRGGGGDARPNKRRR